MFELIVSRSRAGRAAARRRGAIGLPPSAKFELASLQGHWRCSVRAQMPVTSVGWAAVIKGGHGATAQRSGSGPAAAAAAAAPGCFQRGADGSPSGSTSRGLCSTKTDTRQPRKHVFGGGGSGGDDCQFPSRSILFSQRRPPEVPPPNGQHSLRHSSMISRMSALHAALCLC